MRAGVVESARMMRALLYVTLARCSGRRVGLVLVHHAVTREPRDTDRTIVPLVDATSLRRQIRHLRRHYRLVPASAMRGEAAARRRGARIPVALTFDDDLATHVELAAPILLEESAPAAFFVCGASLMEPYAFWWEDLQKALDHQLVGPDDLPELGSDLVAEACSGRRGAASELASMVEELVPARRDAVARVLRERVGPPSSTAGLRAEQVRALAHQGFELGFHTIRHDRLPPLDDAALHAALRDGRDALEAAVRRPVTAISYPHGRADERVAVAARTAGFEVGFTGGERVVEATDDPLLIPRVGSGQGTAGEFAVRIARFVAGRPSTP